MTSDTQERKGRKVTMSPQWLAKVEPEGSPVEWRDATKDGLVLRVETSGTRSWIYRYTADVVNENGETVRKARRYVLGSNLTLSVARKKIKEAVQKGDPQAERERAREGARKRKLGDTVPEAVASWLKDPDHGPATGLGLSQPREWKGGDKGGTARSFMPHVTALGRELKTVRVLDLSERQCRDFMTGKTKDTTLAASTQNHRLAVVRAFLAWARKRKLIEHDPTEELRKRKEPPRNRRYTDEDLRVLLRGVSGMRYGRAFWLLLLTACRRGEILAARWDWLDLDAGTLTIPMEYQKEGEAREDDKIVPLCPTAVRILQAQREAQLAEGLGKVEWIFATATGGPVHRDVLKGHMYVLKGKRMNGREPSRDVRAKVRSEPLTGDLRIHDLRGTTSHALLNRIGLPKWVVNEVVLGHYRDPIEAAYFGLTGKPIDVARDGLEKWAELLDEIVAGKAAKAVPSA